MDGKKTYWFQNSATNIRLGKPIAWQGWAVYIAYIIIVLFGIILRFAFGGSVKYLLVWNQAFWTVILIIIAVKKGKPGIKKEKPADDPDDYWFPKKDIGVGYGFPVTWQGVLVYVAFFAGIMSPAIFKPILGKYFILFMILGFIFWGIFLLVMVIKHGEK